MSAIPSTSHNTTSLDQIQKFGNWWHKLRSQKYSQKISQFVHEELNVKNTILDQKDLLSWKTAKVSLENFDSSIQKSRFYHVFYSSLTQRIIFNSINEIDQLLNTNMHEKQLKAAEKNVFSEKFLRWSKDINTHEPKPMVNTNEENSLEHSKEKNYLPLNICLPYIRIEINNTLIEKIELSYKDLLAECEENPVGLVERVIETNSIATPTTHLPGKTLNRREPSDHSPLHFYIRPMINKNCDFTLFCRYTSKNAISSEMTLSFPKEELYDDVDGKRLGFTIQIGEQVHSYESEDSGSLD